MDKSGSYLLQTFTASAESEVKRLKAQVALFWKKEIQFYRLFGLKDSMNVLECGSGPGYLVEKLLAEFPNSHYTALEVDPYLFKILEKNATVNEQKRYDVVQQSIMNTGFSDNSYDFIITRLVLEHLPDPIGAVKEIYRILKPHGKAVLIANDFEFHLRTYPDIPELKILYDAYCRSRQAEGGNPKIGRELPQILKRAGFVNIDMEIACAHSEITGDELFLKSEGVGISAQLVKDGYLTREALDKISIQWHALLNKDDHAFYRQIFMAAGEKNPNAQPEGYKKSQKPTQHNINKSLCAYIKKADQTLKFELIEKYLCEQVAETLNFKLSDLRPDLSLLDIGFDSLAAVEVRNIIKSEMGIDISVAAFFEGHSIKDISRLLLDEFMQNDNISDTSPVISKSESDGEDKIDTDVWEDGVI
jgi:ubiquinone/menaquinone biosynthesis C-methylase UbiE/acyl carrier protein